jgi:hypothetical protein
VHDLAAPKIKPHISKEILTKLFGIRKQQAF